MGQQLHPQSVAIGTAIRNAITHAGLTQSQFADQSGMTVKTLGRRLSGALPFTYPEIKTAAEVTGVSVGDLMDDADRIHERRAA